jgi:isoquinoline 1-oxidoreductase alpha subunit
MLSLRINGEVRDVDAPADMPLLWVLRDIVGLTGTKFGCGIAQCGACTVHIDGAPVRSCLLPVGSIGQRAITTIEGVGASPAGAKIQKAWLDLEVVQCGYCQSGQIMSATALLNNTRIRRIPTSMRPWRETFAGAAPMCASARRSNMLPKPDALRRDAASNAATGAAPIGCTTNAGDPVTRRGFLQAGMIVGGALMIGFRCLRHAARRLRSLNLRPMPSSASMPAAGSPSSCRRPKWAREFLRPSP